MADKKKAKRNPGLTEKRWIELRAEYEGSDATLKVLSAKYGTYPATISKKADREGWLRPKAQKAMYEKAQSEAIQQAVSESVDHVKGYFSEQTKNFARAKSVLLRQLVIYDIISQADAHKLQRAYESAKPYLLDGDVNTAHSIISSCGINYNAPYKIKTIVDGLVTLDTAERRLLGLERNDNPDQFKQDPMTQWLDDIAQARSTYEKAGKGANK